jgi:hypothetical protein
MKLAVYSMQAALVRMIGLSGRMMPKEVQRESLLR